MKVNIEYLFLLSTAMNPTSELYNYEIVETTQYLTAASPSPPGRRSQAGEIIAEEQAGFRAGRSTTEQIFNLGILCEQYRQHQQNHVFTDFKKAYDRVWHAALWATMREYNISTKSSLHH